MSSEDDGWVNPNQYHDVPAQLIDRARACMDASGSLPNFVTVDFYSVGDLFEAVAGLNGLDR